LLFFRRLFGGGLLCDCLFGSKALWRGFFLDPDYITAVRRDPGIDKDEGLADAGDAQRFVAHALRYIGIEGIIYLVPCIVKIKFHIGIEFGEILGAEEEDPLVAVGVDVGLDTDRLFRLVDIGEADIEIRAGNVMLTHSSDHRQGDALVHGLPSLKLDEVRLMAQVLQLDQASEFRFEFFFCHHFSLFLSRLFGGGFLCGGLFIGNAGVDEDNRLADTLYDKRAVVHAGRDISVEGIVDLVYLFVQAELDFSIEINKIIRGADEKDPLVMGVFMRVRNDGIRFIDVGKTDSQSIAGDVFSPHSSDHRRRDSFVDRLPGFQFNDVSFMYDVLQFFETNHKMLLSDSKRIILYKIYIILIYNRDYFQFGKKWRCANVEDTRNGMLTYEVSNRTMMNTQPPIYLFAGGRGKTIFSSFAEMGKVIRSTGKERPVIAVVGVASLKDNRMVFLLMAALLKLSCKCKVKRVAIADPKADITKAKETLLKSDAVFMSGGDAEAGMEIIKEKNLTGFFQELAGQGKLIFGASAGTIMMAAKWVRWGNPDDDTSAEHFTCLGLAPVICDTHAEGDNWVELKTALQLEKEGAIGYGIPSGAYLKAYPDGRIEAAIEPVVRFAKINGKVEQQPNLLPEGYKE
jgi:peptidase E